MTSSVECGTAGERSRFVADRRRTFSRFSNMAVVLPVGAAGAAVLLLFPPTRNGFYPRCPVYAMTGLLCPGCGGTRAVAALLRGHVHEALRWNALVTLSAMLLAPVSVLYAAGTRLWPDRICRAALQHWQEPLASVALVVAILFALWRNLV